MVRPGVIDERILHRLTDMVTIVCVFWEYLPVSDGGGPSGEAGC